MTRPTNWDGSGSGKGVARLGGSEDGQRLSILDCDLCATIFGQIKWNLVAPVKTHLSLAKKAKRMRFSATASLVLCGGRGGVLW